MTIRSRARLKCTYCCRCTLHEIHVTYENCPTARLKSKPLEGEREWTATRRRRSRGICICLLKVESDLSVCDSQFVERRRSISARNTSRDLSRFREMQARYLTTLLLSRDISLRYVTYTMIRRDVVASYICVYLRRDHEGSVLREMLRVPCLFHGGENQRATCGWIYTLQIRKTKYAADGKTNLHITRDMRAITDNLAVRAAPIYHAVVAK